MSSCRLGHEFKGKKRPLFSERLFIFSNCSYDLASLGITLLDSFILRFNCSFNCVGFFRSRSYLLCLRLVRWYRMSWLLYPVNVTFFKIWICRHIFSKFVDSNAMAWSYMVSSSSLSAWLLHFLLIIICMLPDVLVVMAETQVIYNDVVVDTQVRDFRCLP